MTLGARVRDYEVWGRLGEGGMSEVWLAKHSVLSVPVIMKTLRPALLGVDHEGAMKRVFNEARLMARVVSPRVVRAVDAGLHVGDDGERTPYLVEEYVDGIDLAELDRRRRRALGVGLPLWFVCHVMHELCEALRAAHQTGVVHRDIKPSNVFCAPGTGIRLGDFGIALAQADCARAEISGTVRFMAPEQIRGEAIDRYTDVYGAGATAVDLRYGRPPWNDAASVLDMTRAPTFPAPQSPSEAYFQHVLLRMLDKDPQQRPPDVSEPAQHFASLVRGLRPMRARTPMAWTHKNTVTIGPVTVNFMVGDIAKARADGIVSSANYAMTMRTGVGQALRLRGGDAIEVDAMRGGEQPLGTCVTTAAGSLDARHVIHAVSAWNEASCVGRTTSRALLLADELGHATLAFPALGTGAARVSLETCANAMMTALAWHIAIGGTRLRHVDIVLGDETKLRTFRDVAEDALRDGDEAPPLVDLGLPADETEVRPDGATHLDASPSRRI
jgi:serine/threonine-protein kinase